MAKIERLAEKLNLNIRLSGLNINVVSIAKVEPDPNWYVANHSHHDFEFHIIPRGMGHIRIEDREFVVKGGEFYITGPHVMHEQRTDGRNPMEEYCLECEIDEVRESPDPPASSPSEAGRLIDMLSCSYPHAFTDASGVAAVFDRLYGELDEEKAGYHLKIQALIIEILVDLFRMILNCVHAKYACHVPEKSVDEVRVNRILYFIGNNYKESITISDMAGALFLTPRQINRLMRKEFGRTFHGYLVDFRLSVAKRLLAETDMPIEAIAREAGFSSNYYMYQVFKAHNLPTPAALRAKRADAM